MREKRMKSDEELDGKKHSKHKKKKKHIFLKIVIVLLIIIVILAGILIGYIYSKYSQIEHEYIDESEIEINEGVETKGYKNILLLGVDSRSNEYKNT